METPLLIRVVLDGPTPVYRQVVDQIRVLCLDGRLEPGRKLPSVRQLAGSLGVHFNTIADAYRTLADEGWLEVRQGRSAIVRKRSEPKQPSQAALAQHGSRLRNLVAELRSHGFSKEWIMSEVKDTLEGGLQ